MTMNFLHNYGHHDDRGLIDVSSFSDDIRSRRRQIYRLLIDKEYLSDRLATTKTTKSIIYKINKLKLPNAARIAGHILEHARYLPNCLPRHIWNFFVGLIFNTRPFDMRIRKALNLAPRSDDPDNPFPCRLKCDTGPDSAVHMFGSCPVFLEIKDRFKLNAPRSPIQELCHSFLDFPESGRRKEATSLVIAAWATWCISRKGLFESAAEAVSLILTRINNFNSDSAGRLQEKLNKRAAAAIRRKERALESFQHVERTLASLTRLDSVIFTDGSGKDGFGGAGAYMVLPHRDPNNPDTLCTSITEINAPLGKGTNNFSELWAVGMSLEMILVLREEGRWVDGDVHIFSDSDYSIGGVTGTKKLRTNLGLLKAVREKNDLLGSLGINVFFHWVKGHADIEFNEFADKLRLAGKANVASADGQGLDFNDRNELISSGNLIDFERVTVIIHLDNG